MGSRKVGTPDLPHMTDAELDAFLLMAVKDGLVEEVWNPKVGEWVYKTTPKGEDSFREAVGKSKEGVR